MTQEQLRSSVPAHMQGLWLAGACLVVLMDDPGMTLEKLRRSDPAIAFRQQAIAMSRWLAQAIEQTPPEALPPEERRFMEFWFGQMHRAEATNARLLAKDRT